MSRNIAIQIAYQGSKFHGYQIQPEQRTVQLELENALQQILGHKPQTTCAGRTDAGVHAYSQVVNFTTEHTLPVERFKPAINSALPADIHMIQAVEVPLDFSARFSPLARHYRYLIGTQSVQHPHLSGTCWYYQRPLDIELMKKCWESLSGSHDFSAFCKSGSYRKNFVIPIQWTRFWQYKGFLVLEIMGQSFLYNMVRTLVGTVLDIGRGSIPPEHLNRALTSGQRKWVGRTAPPQGLCLFNVVYPPQFGLELINLDLHDWPVPLTAPEGPRLNHAL